MTLKEFCENTKVDCKVVDVRLWDESKEDYTITFGFVDSPDFCHAVLFHAKSDKEIQKCLFCEVSNIEVVVSFGEPLMLIELKEPAREKSA